MYRDLEDESELIRDRASAYFKILQNREKTNAHRKKNKIQRLRTNKKISKDLGWKRYHAYEKLEWTEEALKDEFWQIRLMGYKIFGFTEKAKKDDYFFIRYLAYETLGFTEEALEDKNFYIRLKAQENLSYKEQANEYFENLKNKKEN